MNSPNIERINTYACLVDTIHFCDNLWQTTFTLNEF